MDKELQFFIDCLKDSPFNPGGDLRHPIEFIGRAVERKQIIEERAYFGYNTSILGPPGFGKTWLIQYLAKIAPYKLGGRFKVAYIDLNSYTELTISDFVGSCLNQLQYPVPKKTALKLIHLETALEELKAQRHGIIICIDSFECFFSKKAIGDFDNNFFDGLRAIGETGIGFVVGSRRALLEVLKDRIGPNTSPFYNNFYPIHLEEFKSFEAQKFLELHCTVANFTLLEKEKLLLMCQNNPLKMQLAGTLIQQAREGHTEASAYWQIIQEVLDYKYNLLCGNR